MDRDLRQPGVARLLQAFDEERPVARRVQHVRVEIVAFDTRGVGEDDAAHAERGELCPQPPQDLGTGQRQQQIDVGRG